MLSALLFRRIAGIVVGALGLGLLGVGPVLAQAQQPEGHCLLLPIEPAYRAQQSALVVEAQVLDARSFWDVGHRRLFTRHRLRVFSLLKGQVADTTGLVVITEGGRLGLDQQILTNTLRLTAGQQGILFLTPTNWAGVPGPAFTPFGSEQGFIEYNPAEGSATEPFRTYSALGANFYQEIAQLTKQPRRVLFTNPALVPVVQPARRGTLAPSITGFSPQILPAGSGAVLTISGSGFGTSRGSGFVEFKNADDGGATRVKAREADYLTWTDTQIQVRVPSAANGGQPASNGHPAGSGRVRITTADQQTGESPGPVTIIYALTNVESTDGTVLQRPNHVALNTSGGITFRFGPSFTPNPAATAAWQRALTTWRCQTGMNWEVGPTAPTDAIADDNQNIVAFDAGAQLPALVLGRTTSYYRGCFAPSGEVIFRVKEIDMQFDDAAAFQFGPLPPIVPQIDFESVAVHELGHAQQLGHLILPNAVMHYAVARGQQTRTLNPNSDVAGGRQVLRVRSFRNLGCGGPALLPAPLTSFSAQYAAAGATVAWTTRDECFLSSFIVERSLGADTTAWEPLGTVLPSPPAGSYQFVDAQPPGGLRYYRLRLLRPDGSRDNAAPLVLSADGAGVSLFPNPVADDQLRLQYPAPATGAVIFRFSDTLGRQVRALSINVPVGLNVLSLDIAGLAPGLYILRWQDAQGKAGSRKFVRL